VTRQRGFKPKSAKNKRALEALDQKAVEALAAAFPEWRNRSTGETGDSQPETHWGLSVRPVCSMSWHEDCTDVCQWGCCYCTCDCHDRE